MCLLFKWRHIRKQVINELVLSYVFIGNNSMNDKCHATQPVYLISKKKKKPN